MNSADIKRSIENGFHDILKLCMQMKEQVFGADFEIGQGFWCNEAGVIVGYISLLSPVLTEEPLEFVLHASPQSGGFELSADVCTPDGNILMTAIAPCLIQNNSTQTGSELDRWLERVRSTVPNILAEMLRIGKDRWIR